MNFKNLDVTHSENSPPRVRIKLFSGIFAVIISAQYASAAEVSSCEKVLDGKSGLSQILFRIRSQAALGQHQTVKGSVPDRISRGAGVSSGAANRRTAQLSGSSTSDGKPPASRIAEPEYYRRIFPDSLSPVTQRAQRAHADQILSMLKYVNMAKILFEMAGERTFRVLDANDNSPLPPEGLAAAQGRAKIVVGASREKTILLSQSEVQQLATSLLDVRAAINTANEPEIALSSKTVEGSAPTYTLSHENLALMSEIIRTIRLTEKTPDTDLTDFDILIWFGKWNENVKKLPEKDQAELLVTSFRELLGIKAVLPISDPSKQDEVKALREKLEHKYAYWSNTARLLFMVKATQDIPVEAIARAVMGARKYDDSYNQLLLQIQELERDPAARTYSPNPFSDARSSTLEIDRAFLERVRLTYAVSFSVEEVEVNGTYSMELARRQLTETANRWLTTSNPPTNLRLSLILTRVYMVEQMPEEIFSEIRKFYLNRSLKIEQLKNEEAKTILLKLRANLVGKDNALRVLIGFIAQSRIY